MSGVNSETSQPRRPLGLASTEVATAAATLLAAETTFAVVDAVVTAAVGMGAVIVVFVFVFQVIEAVREWGYSLGSLYVPWDFLTDTFCCSSSPTLASYHRLINASLTHFHATRNPASFSSIFCVVVVVLRLIFVVAVTVVVVVIPGLICDLVVVLIVRCSWSSKSKLLDGDQTFPIDFAFAFSDVRHL